jgi:hypothetical protein
MVEQMAESDRTDILDQVESNQRLLGVHAALKPAASGGCNAKVRDFGGFVPGWIRPCLKRGFGGLFLR